MVRKKDNASELLERRQELFKQVVKFGKPVDKVAHEIAKDFNCKPNTLIQDWVNRERWLPSIYRIQNAGTIVFDILSEQQEVKRELWEIATNPAIKPSTKVSALDKINHINQKLVDMLYELGIIQLKNEKNKPEVHMTQINIGELPEERRLSVLKAYAGEFDADAEA